MTCFLLFKCSTGAAEPPRRGPLAQGAERVPLGTSSQRGKVSSNSTNLFHFVPIIKNDTRNWCLLRFKCSTGETEKPQRGALAPGAKRVRLDSSSKRANKGEKEQPRLRPLPPGANSVALGSSPPRLKRLKKT